MDLVWCEPVFFNKDFMIAGFEMLRDDMFKCVLINLKTKVALKLTIIWKDSAGNCRLKYFP